MPGKYLGTPRRWSRLPVSRRLLWVSVLASSIIPILAHAQDRTVADAERMSYMLVRNAKQLCSVIFVVGRTAEEAMAIGDVTRFTRLTDDWDWKEVDVRVALEEKRVTLGRQPAPPRTAVFHEGQGCTMLPEGGDGVFFQPEDVTSNLPPPDETPWPMGDVLSGQTVRGIDRSSIETLLDSVFGTNDPEQGERGWVILHDGWIAAERYAPGYDSSTRNLSFSAGKSLVTTLAGILVGDGHLDVDDATLIPDWQAPDARSQITVRHLLHMASGLDCNNYGFSHPLHFTPQNHHAIGYNDGVNAVEASVAPLLRFIPGTVNRYRNCDLLAAGDVVRQIVEREYDVAYLAFPQRFLFDRIGVRTAVIEPDPYGNLLMNGHNYLTTRDWARWGLLYLQDGVFDGYRILPEGWATFASTPSPANPGYGAFFWLATEDSVLPTGTYWASGAEGNQTFIIPSHGLVVSRNAWNSGVSSDTLVARIAESVIKVVAECANDGWRRFEFDHEGDCRDFVSGRGELN